MRFDLTGYDIDNLLKKLYLKKVTLLNVTRTSHDKVSFEIKDSDYNKVKRYIANFRVVKTLSRVKRLPKFMLANLGIILSVFFGLIFLIFASNYTWQIRIYGIEALSEKEIIGVLSENNIRIGKINHQTSEEIEYILLNNYDRIAQVSVIRKGTSIIINLSEKLVYNEEEFTPICAKYNGIITHINVVTGTVNVKVGDYVNVGDVLVLPFNVNANGEKVSVKPFAEIEAEIFIVAKEQMSKVETVLLRTGKKMNEYHYKLFNFSIFSGMKRNSFALFETVSYNEYISDLVPFSRDVVTYYELATSEITHDFSIEKDSLIARSVDNARSKIPPNSTKKDEKTELTTINDTMYACTTITVRGLIND